MASLRTRLEPRISSLQGSDTAKAAGLAGAMIANNVIALVSTVVFARLLDDYGSLGALISYLLILTVVGQAMQVATAREGVLGHLGVGYGLIATTKRWTRTLLLVTAGLTVVSVLLRNPIASAVGVHRYPWAAALGIPAGCMYLEVSLLRGALQGVGNYKGVGLSLIGEQAVRLVTGAAFAIPFSVTGAYVGSILSYIAMSAYCAVQLRPTRPITTSTRPEPGSHPQVSLWSHVRRALAPIAGLAVIAVLQNIDIIAAKHRFSSHEATSYAAVAVAAKVLIWVAIGAGFYLVPEVSRRRADGEDTRPVLLRTLGIILVCAIPCLLIFAFAAHPLISAVFGAKKASAYRVAAATRRGVHGAVVHLPRDPVHAGAEAHVVPDRDRRRRDRRTRVPAPGQPPAARIRCRGARDPGGRGGGRVLDRLVAARQRSARYGRQPRAGIAVGAAQRSPPLHRTPPSG